MDTQIDNAIKLLAERINKTLPSDEALRLTQAALNLAHTKAILRNLV
jgi:hypothetical protein